MVTLHAGLPSNASFPLRTIHACTQLLPSQSQHTASTAGFPLPHASSADTDIAVQAVDAAKPQGSAGTPDDQPSHAASAPSDVSSSVSNACACSQLAGSTSSLNSIPSDAGSGNEDTTTSYSGGAPHSSHSTTLQYAATSTATPSHDDPNSASHPRPCNSGEQQPPASTSASTHSSNTTARGLPDLPEAVPVPLAHVCVDGQLVADAQQYMFHSGHPPLLQWVRTVTQRCHSPPQATECAITSGAVSCLHSMLLWLQCRGIRWS